MCIFERRLVFKCHTALNFASKLNLRRYSMACKGTPGAVCDDCGKCVRREFLHKQQKQQRRYSGGTGKLMGQCEGCVATAVMDGDVAAAVLDRVVEVMEGLGAAGATGRIPLELVESERLTRAADKRHRGPNDGGARGVTRTKIVIRGSAPKDQWVHIMDNWEMEHGKSGYGQTGHGDRLSPLRHQVHLKPPPRQLHSPGTTSSNAAKAMQHPDVSVSERRYLKGVWALTGMSRVAMGAVLAHEYGHCYLFMRRFPPLTLQTEVGWCRFNR